jgi:uncharacterized protein YkwD
MNRSSVLIVMLAGLSVASCGGGGGGVPNPNPNPGGGPPGITVPPAESFVDRSSAADSAATKFLKNSYKTLPAPFDANRVFQNASTMAWADEVLRLTNIERTNAGLTALVRDDHLEMVVQAYCRDMALRNYTGHVNPEGLNPIHRLDAVQPPPRWGTGENVAQGQDSPQEVVAGWMASPGHRLKIMDPLYTHMGVGFYYDPSADQFGTYWGQLFATFKPEDYPPTYDWLDPDEAP